ncbi:hypothetical protein SAMN04487969_101606 [Paenibacillus algorifonticola]|uniref:Tissue inhibitor of metalloproteinase n=1 Tax=Paenibacillus algorifonticola TaxID=684063 RepID=A0A1I1YKW3_9BACL|nr:hypothetical protein [Paenibacillus algorifonticola]SFE20039.1 hypothetical protein SAMN04487969_101606 [Paenibacillus algorifonticola]
MKKWLILSLLLLWLLPSQVSALSCAQMRTPAEAFDWYDGIVIAKVNERYKTIFANDNKLVLTVSTSYKGIEARTLSVSEDPTWGALNGPSEEGVEYLFFLKEKDGKWEHPLCAPSMTTPVSKEMAAFLKDKELDLKAQESVAKQQTTPVSEGTPHNNSEQSDSGVLGSWLIVALALLVLVIAVGVVDYRRYGRRNK